MSSAATLAPACAVFDVDETLWNTKSVLELYRYFLTADYGAAACAVRWQRLREAVDAQIAAGAQRHELNAWFYQHHFAGLYVQRAQELCDAWWRQRCLDPQFLITPVVERAQEHAVLGHRLVLLTGSFYQAVRPLQELLGAHAVLASPLEEVDGKFTGRLLGAAMIGDGKAKALARYLAAENISPAQCWAYADDESDIGFLELVGRPVIVDRGDSPMSGLAAERGWQIFPVAGHGMPLSIPTLLRA